MLGRDQHVTARAIAIEAVELWSYENFYPNQAESYSYFKEVYVKKFIPAGNEKQLLVQTYSNKKTNSSICAK